MRETSIMTEHYVCARKITYLLAPNCPRAFPGKDESMLRELYIFTSLNIFYPTNCADRQGTEKGYKQTR